MRFARTRLENGRLGDTGEHFELAADAIFKAIGQASKAPAWAIRWQRNCGATASASRSTDRCAPASPASTPAATAWRSARTLTVQAVQHGKLAAEAIHAQLMLNVEAA